MAYTSLKPAAASYTNGPDTAYITVTSTYQYINMLGGDDTATINLSGMVDWVYSVEPNTSNLLLTSYGLDVARFVNVENFHFINGAGGSDLRGLGGNDIIEGGGGDDTLRDSNGLDKFYGGDGVDLIIIEAWLAGKIIDGGAGSDTVEYNLSVYWNNFTISNYFGSFTMSGDSSDGPTITNVEWRGVKTGAGIDNFTIYGTEVAWKQYCQGGLGIDTATLYYANATSGVRFYQDTDGFRYLGLDHPGAGYASDIKIKAAVNDDIENVIVYGSAFNDIFYAVPLTTNTFIGGAGYDQVIFNGTKSQYVVSYNEINGYFSVSGGPEGSINNINGFESFEFTDGVFTATQLIEPFGPVSIFGTAGADTLYGNGADNKIYGFAGNDILAGMTGNDTIYGGTENDRIYGGFGNDTLLGENGSDTIITSAFIVAGQSNSGGTSYVEGGNGDDFIYTYGKQDLALGGDGNDVLYAASDYATYFYGGHGNDSLVGAGGNDYLVGVTGNDTITGGGGNDIIVTSKTWPAYVDYNNLSARSTSYADGGAGDDYIYTYGEKDVAAGGMGNDVLYAASAKTTYLYGGDNADTLYGNAENDYLIAGQGSDILLGGTGTDYLVGGTGSDNFILNSDISIGGYDIIADFEAGIDFIGLPTRTQGNSTVTDTVYGVDIIYSVGYSLTYQILVTNTHDVNQVNAAIYYLGV